MNTFLELLTLKKVTTQVKGSVVQWIAHLNAPSCHEGGLMIDSWQTHIFCRAKCLIKRNHQAFPWRRNYSYRASGDCATAKHVLLTGCAHD